MPWNNGVFTRDNGTYVGPNVWDNDARANVNIEADRHDIHDQDLANGISNALAKDGQNSPTANLPMNGRKHTNVADGSARNEYASLGQLRDSIIFMPNSVVGGSANAITFTPVTPFSEYTAGQQIVFVGRNDSTGSVTLNVSSLGPKSIVKENNKALQSGDIKAGTVYLVVYDGTRFKLFGGPIADIPASKVTSGKFPSSVTATKPVTGASLGDFDNDDSIATTGWVRDALVLAETSGAPGATGPQGPKGDKGDPGAKGDKGDTGAAGSGITVVRVASETAYDAVSNKVANTWYVWPD